MAHVSIAAHRPKAGDGKFGVVQGYADGMPGVRVRRVIRKRQRAAFDEPIQCRPEAIREIKAELFGWFITMRKKW
jgi:hypothetical protein